jgi:hypothetical protein
MQLEKILLWRKTLYRKAGKEMIIDNNPVAGLKSELNALDRISTALGFVRWQWEYDRATYDYKIEHKEGDFFLRIDSRCIQAKLEKPHAVLELRQAYIGVATFPHGLDYNSPIPADVLAIAAKKLEALQQVLTSNEENESAAWQNLYSSAKDELAQVKKERDELLQKLGNK